MRSSRENWRAFCNSCPPNSSLCRFGESQSFRAMKTSLSLLTREGSVDVTFAAVLTPEQYAKYQSIQHTKKPKVTLPKGQGTVQRWVGHYGFN